MYVCISCTGNLRAGDVIILEKNNDFDEVTARMIGGGVIGFITDRQPEGCVSKALVEHAIGNRMVIGHVAILNGNVALFYSDSTAFDEPSYSHSRRERCRVF